MAATVHAQNIRIYVDAAAPAGGNGLTWDTAFRDLQDALTVANSRPSPTSVAVEIRVAQGIYTPDRGTLDRTKSFVVGSATTLRGGFLGLLAGPSEDSDHNDPARFVSVLSGDLQHNDGPANSSRLDNTHRIVNSIGWATQVRGFTIRGAAAAISQTAGSNCIVRQCIIADHLCDSSTVANPLAAPPIVGLTNGFLWQCAIADNRSALASVVRVAASPGSTVSGLWQCIIAGNRLAQDGSGFPLSAALVDLPGSTLSIDACLIAANSSDTYCLSTGCGVPLYNCTIADNRAYAAPGLSGCAATIYNCIFARNITTGPGGSTGPQVLGYGPYLLRCFLDRGVTDVQATGGVINATFTFSGTPGFMGASGPDNNPATWQDNDYRLAPGSPCIDSGDSLYIPNQQLHASLSGVAVFDDPGAANTGSGPVAIVDIGALERGPTPCLADFDNSGVLTTLDLMSFLNTWIAGNITADFNHSGTLTAHDVLEFINVWFEGC